MTSTQQINLTVVGANGIDVASAAPANDTALYIYLIKHLTSGGVLPIASREISLSNVTYPSGYGSAKVAKHPFAFVYKSIGIPPLSALRNFATVYFTDSDDSGYYDLVANTTTSGAWVAFSAAAFPDSARALRVVSRTDYNSGTGDARLRPGSGSSAAGRVVGKVTAAGQSDWSGEHRIMTNSTRDVGRNTATGVRNWIQIVGYAPLEI